MSKSPTKIFGEIRLVVERRYWTTIMVTAPTVLVECIKKTGFCHLSYQHQQHYCNYENDSLQVGWCLVFVSASTSRCQTSVHFRNGKLSVRKKIKKNTSVRIGWSVGVIEHEYNEIYPTLCIMVSEWSSGYFPPYEVTETLPESLSIQRDGILWSNRGIWPVNRQK